MPSQAKLQAPAICNKAVQSGAAGTHGQRIWLQHLADSLHSVLSFRAQLQVVLVPASMSILRLSHVQLICLSMQMRCS